MGQVLRHGDIILREVEGPLPEGKKHIGFSQSGETGKLHVAPQVTVIERDGGVWILPPPWGDTMTHPEHPPLAIPPGKVFRVERVRSVTRYVD